MFFVPVSDFSRRFHIGTLCAGDKTSLVPSSLKVKREPQAVFLSTSEWNKATLSSVTKVSDDTKLFRFLLDHEKQAFGLVSYSHNDWIDILCFCCNSLPVSISSSAYDKDKK